ncbi:GNAT family N-acetyltransferase [Anaerotruncus colihominis]|uniref:GNAT family N-acetyltransferase n=1 Tax=Anaerotruncus colihominis TaxID=169435 RepID=A0A845RHH0_9FIRM|nr:GNAT family N-acetyltransferase [Anaerotruncus colihominis]NBI79009.1 GNAT family N-acetyltransferase [Anaerotruncus colihominis]
MGATIRQYTEKDLAAVTKIWNEVVAEGNAFPQDTPFTPDEARAFFASQSFTGVAESDGRIVGVYILHPNNTGHCAHIANASYGVSSDTRGTGMGERLVLHSLEMCKKRGFVGLQFNAVVCSNTAAIRLYEKLGFERIGATKNGYRFKDGHYEDLFLFNKPLI